MSFSNNKKNKVPYQLRTVLDCTYMNDLGTVYWRATGPDVFTRQIFKPDKTRNPMDETGWRKPSRYHTHPGEIGPCLFGIIENQRYTYLGGAPGRDRISLFNSAILGGEGVQFGFRVSPGRAPALWQMPLTDIWSRISWEMEQAVRVQAIASLASRKGKILETFAEMRSSVRGLASNASEISWFIDNHRDSVALRKKFNLPKKHAALKRMRKIAQTTKGAAEFFGKQWLNFWFGLSPIVDEMVFVTAILSNPENFRRLRVKGTGHRWVDEVLQPSATFSAKQGMPNVPRLDVKMSIPLRVGIRLSAYYQVESETLAGLKQYGLVDVASTAWAIAPLSWMVDWVFPVTKLLESYEGLAGLSYRGGTITKYYVIGDTTIDATWVKSHNYEIVDPPFSPRAELLAGKGFTRDIVLPMGMLPAPYIKDPLNLWTATTGLSFMAQKLKRVLNAT